MADESGHTFGDPSRADLVSVVGELFCAIPEFDWHAVTARMSPPCREWLADAVDQYFRDDPVEDDGQGSPGVLADRWWRAPRG